MWQEMSKPTHRNFSNPVLTLLTFQVLKDFYRDDVEQKAEIQKKKKKKSGLHHPVSFNTNFMKNLLEAPIKTY